MTNAQRIAELETALRQILWMADADDPLSVKVAIIAREALERRQRPAGDREDNQ